MRLHFLTIPIHGSAAAEDELNIFLGSRRVVAVDRHLVPDGMRSAWAICVAYVDGSPVAASTSSGTADPGGKKNVDYKEILPPADFAVFAALRELRKKLAQRDGVPPYAIFTNEQLADMVRGKVRSAADLARIDGVGASRVEKYATSFLEILCAPPATAAAAAAATTSATT